MLSVQHDPSCSLHIRVGLLPATCCTYINWTGRVTISLCSCSVYPSYPPSKAEQRVAWRLDRLCCFHFIAQAWDLRSTWTFSNVQRGWGEEGGHYLGKKKNWQEGKNTRGGSWRTKVAIKTHKLCHPHHLGWGREQKGNGHSSGFPTPLAPQEAMYLPMDCRKDEDNGCLELSFSALVSHQIPSLSLTSSIIWKADLIEGTK